MQARKFEHFLAQLAAPTRRKRQRLLDSHSIRRAAAQLGVAGATSFRWRHRFLRMAMGAARPAIFHT